MIRRLAGLIGTCVSLAGLASCTADDGGATPTVVTVVTVSRTVAAGPAGSLPGTASGFAPPSASNSPTPDPDRPVEPSSSVPPPTTTVRTGPDASTRTPTSRSPVSQAAADPDVPGPDNGPPCPADRQYSNEAPTGLRDDVVTGWRSAVAAAKADDVVLCLNDGKRSAAQQRAIFADYVKQYGEKVARQYVLPPAKSAHVAGYAVDVQPEAAYRWLQGTAGRLGWCRIYDNEPWHFEYSLSYRRNGCPARLPKPEG